MSTAIRRLLGTLTIACVGLGVAIGSGIFATPGEIAAQLPSPGLILAAWLLGGVVTFLQSLVTAELSTRIPLAGGEYQFLRGAFGDFAGFFFGWSFTIFIVGAGAGTIAAGLGEFAATLLGSPKNLIAAFGLASIAAVLAINLLGLRAGAFFQNFLTLLKVAAVVGIGFGAMFAARRWTPQPVESGASAGLKPFLLAFVGVFWSYSGSTDSAKLAEETIGARHAIPRGLAWSAGLLTVVYVLFNYGLLCAVSPAQMAGKSDAVSLAFADIGGMDIRKLILAVGVLICLGSLSSTILSNVRVTFAMARDGLAPKMFAQMSSRQAPIASLILAATIACIFVLNRSFGQILGIYFMASAILYGMSYMSLLVFRHREQNEPSASGDYYRVPFGRSVAVLLTVFQLSIAAMIAHDELRKGGRDSLYMLALLAAVALMYPLWKRLRMLV